jgi:hypothetical protein
MRPVALLLLIAALALALPASAAGATPRIFPSDSLTEPDRRQVTGRRVALPLRNCRVRASECNDQRLRPGGF